MCNECLQSYIYIYNARWCFWRRTHTERRDANIGNTAKWWNKTRWIACAITHPTTIKNIPRPSHCLNHQTHKHSHTIFPRAVIFHSVPFARSASVSICFRNFHLAIKITRRHNGDAPWLAQGYPPERVYIFHYYIFIFFVSSVHTHGERRNLLQGS